MRDDVREIARIACQVFRFPEPVRRTGKLLVPAQVAANFPHTVIGIVREGKPLPRMGREKFAEAMAGISLPYESPTAGTPSCQKPLAAVYHEGAYTHWLAGWSEDARRSLKRAIYFRPIRLKNYAFPAFRYLPPLACAAVRRLKKMLWP